MPGLCLDAWLVVICHLCQFDGKVGASSNTNKARNPRSLPYGRKVYLFQGRYNAGKRFFDRQDESSIAIKRQQ